MACVRVDLDTLIIYSLIDFDDGVDKINYNKEVTLDNLKTIINRVANSTGRYVFSDTTVDNFCKTLNEYPKLFICRDSDSLSIQLAKNQNIPKDWFSFGYDPEILKEITKQSKIVLDGLKEQQLDALF